MSLFCSCITCLCRFKWPPGLCKIFWTLRGWKGIRNYFLPSLRFPLIQLSWSGFAAGLLQRCAAVSSVQLDSGTSRHKKNVFEKSDTCEKIRVWKVRDTPELLESHPSWVPTFCLRVCVCLHGNATILISLELEQSEPCGLESELTALGFFILHSSSVWHCWRSQASLEFNLGIPDWR